jgi:8-oxo-dGTP diphosphatase
MPRRTLERPILAVDVVLLALRAGALCVRLQRRQDEPFAGAQALPGVAVRADETLLEAARRSLLERGGLGPDDLGRVHLEQLFTFDGLYRDPRGRTISVAYLGLTREPVDDTALASWRAVQARGSGRLPFDHDQIVAQAVARLRGKLRYTNLAGQLLDEPFAVEALRAVYEAVLGRPLNRSNFREKLVRIGLIERVGIADGASSARGGRPAHLYRFVQRGVEAEDREFV